MVSKQTVMSWFQKAPTDKQIMVKWLRDVSTGEVMLGGTGICHLLSRLPQRNCLRSSEVRSFVRCGMYKYAEENGTCRAYPVPHPTMGPSEAYTYHKRNHASMNDESVYGMNRRKLAKWLADELENSDVE